jgi:hypothetical protein
MKRQCARIWLSVFVVGVSGREVAASEAKRPLENAAVFAGPGEATLEMGPNRVARAPERVGAAAFWKRCGELKSAVARAKSVVIFEGLPRGPKGKEHLSAEQKKSLVLIDGEAFYPTAQAVAPELAEQLRSTLFAGVRERKDGVKLCGGFHADFFLRWSDERGATDALICFGCQEVKLDGATGELYGDLANDEAKTLRELLAPFWKRKNLAGQREEIPAPPARL